MPKTIHSPRHQVLIERLRQYREQAGITQAQVAARLGRHQPFIANIENGERRVDLVELMAIAEIIGLDIRDLLDELEGVPQQEASGRARLWASAINCN